MIRVKRQLVLLLRVMWDFVQGMYAFHPVESCITVFGSARLTAQSQEYAAARAVGVALAENGHTVMTGGGPGLMEAASRGAREAGGKCIACRIRLSLEQTRNNYIDRSVSFRYFFVRKVMLLRNSYALVVLPGGLGTLDELFEVLTLIQTRKLLPLPIIFIGREYWKPLLDVVKQMVTAGTISAGEMDHVASLMLITDDAGEMIAHLKAHVSHVADSRPIPKRTGAPAGRHSKTEKASAAAAD
ncbi:MAG TPA: TIGR00730 family Rossman fold protein [Candidatus Angelobacter sp.]|nr:TIGR00730 family Rossman fold protein [Candidatus Angelobacter sp.]